MGIAPASSHGGSASKSYLSTSQAVAGVLIPVAGLTVVFDFPADGQSGADVTLSADGKTFTLVNDGIYSILVSASLTCTLADAINVGLGVVTDAGDPFVQDSPPIISEDVAAGASILRTVTVPSMWWTGGATFTVTELSHISDTNMTMHLTIVIVSRVA